MKEYENYNIINKLPNEIFINFAINNQFEYYSNLSLIIIIFIKFIILEYNYDLSLTIQIKKFIFNLSENICILFDLYVFQNLSDTFNLSKKLTIEKIKIIARTTIKSFKKSKITEIILQNKKQMENISISIKFFSKYSLLLFV